MQNFNPDAFFAVTRARKYQLDSLKLDEKPVVLIKRNLTLDRYVLQKFGNAPVRRHSQSILKVASDVPAAAKRARAKSIANIALTSGTPNSSPRPIPRLIPINPINRNDSRNSTHLNATPQSTRSARSHNFHSVAQILNQPAIMNFTSVTPPSTLSSPNIFMSPGTSNASTPRATRNSHSVAQFLLDRLNAFDNSNSEEAAGTPVTSNDVEMDDPNAANTVSGAKTSMLFNDFNPFTPVKNLAFSLGGRRRTASLDLSKQDNGAHRRNSMPNLD